MQRPAPPVLVTGLLFCSALTLRVGLAGSPSLPSIATDGRRTASVGAVQTGGAQSTTQPDYNALIDKYCVECHNARLKRGSLNFVGFDIAKIGEHPEIGEKMIRKLRTGLMPPKDTLQPTAAIRQSIVMALETRLDAVAAARPNPGRRTFQRLNRAEYAAAIRSLFGIDVDVSTYLPADTISASFDNIADVQMPSATVMQGYMRAAAFVSRAAAGDPAADPTSAVYEVPRTQSQKDRVEFAPFGTRGGTVVTHNFPADGKYKFQVLLHGEPAGLLFGRTVRDIQIEVAIDGERAALLKFDRWQSESDPDGLTMTTPPIQVRAGPRRVSATFIQEFEGTEDDLIKPIDHTLADTQIGVGYGVTTLPHLRNLSLTGPFEVTGVSDFPARAKIFSCRPTRAERSRTVRAPDPRSARDGSVPPARQRARRRRADALLPARREEPAASRAASARPCRRCSRACTSCSAPKKSPATVPANGIYRISDVDLASRLSFFLWGTIPDRELIDAARRGELSMPAAFERQVRRLLADRRASALGTRFAAQWLRLQDLHKVEPDALSFPYYDESLAAAMEHETELVFNHLVRDDRPMLEFLTADYTFVNERLARHYGIDGVSGPEFRKVAYPDDHPARPARPRQHPDVDVARQPHVAGAPGQVGARGTARQPAASAAGRRAGSRGNG